MLNILMVYTINTGLLTGATSLLAFILGLAFPNTLISDGLNLCTAKLYANSMLAVLNSRYFLSSRGLARKSGYGVTPSKISPIHPSALAMSASSFKWPPEGGFPALSPPGMSPDASDLQLQSPFPYVLDIKAAGETVSGEREASCGGDTVSTDRTSESSLELREQQDPSQTQVHRSL
ncbi:hypothetical protein GSI_05504 [Ganoderma sinense ZZ0214-1]|uniref:DUF6534 domain-containing protein n=1 Tax=Ganoderma sinense ZZ0214-1 TaxID=1077348 RepID=A0A2G8SER6_9APHY|nr:hypothetical protein GSI_05504 [Ganoderma sinense ZZ0214-1]